MRASDQKKIKWVVLSKRPERLFIIALVINGAWSE